MFSAAVSKAQRLLFLGVFAALLAVSSPFSQARQNYTQESSSAISLASLPNEARVTHALILAGGPFPFEKDGVVFGNRERLLPLAKRGYYREYTVKTPGVRHRGARRMVCGGTVQNPQACYYSNDHYASFRKLAN